MVRTLALSLEGNPGRSQTSSQVNILPPIPSASRGGSTWIFNSQFGAHKPIFLTRIFRAKAKVENNKPLPPLPLLRSKAAAGPPQAKMLLQSYGSACASVLEAPVLSSLGFGPDAGGATQLVYFTF